MNKYIILIILLSAAYLAQSGTISNVTTTQRTDGSKIVDIYYDLSGDSSMYRVAAKVNVDRMPTFTSLTNVTGDINKYVSTGMGKHIIWEAGKQYPDLSIDSAYIKIIADECVMLKLRVVSELKNGNEDKVRLLLNEIDTINSESTLEDVQGLFTVLG